MDEQQQHPGVGVEHQQRGPEKQLGFEPEHVPAQLGYRLVELICGDLGDRELHLALRMHELVRNILVFNEIRAQRLVPDDYIVERIGQRGGVHDIHSSSETSANLASIPGRDRRPHYAVQLFDRFGEAL